MSDEDNNIPDDQDDITILHDLQIHDEDGNPYPVGSPPQFQFFSEGGAGTSNPSSEDTAGSNVALKTAYDHVRGQNEQLKKGLKSVWDKNQQLKMLAKASPVATFHTAAASGNVDQIHELLDSGFDVNGRNSEGRTVLHTAVTSGQKNACSLLLHAHADPNASDHDGRCPIHMACRNGDIENCKLLVEFGADINAMDRDGRTSLHMASANGYPEICQLLIETGKAGDVSMPIINETDLYGQTPLLMAQKNDHSDVFKILKDAGADLPPLNVDNHPTDRSDDYAGDTSSIHRFEGKITTLQKIIISLYRILSILMNSVDIASKFPDLKDRVDNLRLSSQDVDEGSEVNELQSIARTLEGAIELQNWGSPQPEPENTSVASGQSESKVELERKLREVQFEISKVKYELEQEYKENAALKEQVKNKDEEIQRLLSDAENVDLYSATNLEEGDGELYDIGRLFSKVAHLERNSKELGQLVQDQVQRLKGQRRGPQQRQVHQTRQGSSSLPVPQINQASNSGTVRQASSLQNENGTSRNILRLHDIRLPPSDLEQPHPNNRVQVVPSDPQRQTQPLGYQQASPQQRPRIASTGHPGRRQEYVAQAGPGSWPRENTNTADPHRLSQSDPTKMQDSGPTRPSANRSPGFVPRSPSREVPNQPFESVKGPPACDYSSQSQSRYVEGASQVHIFEDGMPTSPRRSGGQSNQRFLPASTPSGEVQNMYPVSCSDERQRIGLRDQIVIPGARDPQEDVWTEQVIQTDELATGLEQVGQQRFVQGQTAFNAPQQFTREPAPKGIECPVCNRFFPPGVPEDNINAHVNRHFDGNVDVRDDVGDFEVLPSQ